MMSHKLSVATLTLLALPILAPSAFAQFGGNTKRRAQEKPAPAPAGVEVGKPAPKFKVNDHTGKGVSVGGQSKTWTVLAFYPKAMTGG